MMQLEQEDFQILCKVNKCKEPTVRDSPWCDKHWPVFNHGQLDLDPTVAFQPRLF